MYLKSKLSWRRSISGGVRGVIFNDGKLTRSLMTASWPFVAAIYADNSKINIAGILRKWKR
jgi:hypothetical protein